MDELVIYLFFICWMVVLFIVLVLICFANREMVSGLSFALVNKYQLTESLEVKSTYISSSTCILLNYQSF